MGGARAQGAPTHLNERMHAHSGGGGGAIYHNR